MCLVHAIHNFKCVKLYLDVCPLIFGRGLKLPAWKVGDRGFAPHSGLQVLILCSHNIVIIIIIIIIIIIMIIIIIIIIIIIVLV